MKTIYLDIDDVVVGQSSIPRTLEIAQTVNPNIVEVVQDAPDVLVYKDAPNSVLYHRRISGDGTLIEHYEEVVYLDRYKEERINVVNEKTTELLSQGFIYDGHRFGMSEAFTALSLALTVVDQTKAIEFPIPIQAIDDTIYNVDDRQTVRYILASTTAGIMEIKGQGASLVNTITAASTQAEVDAVEDLRVPLEIPPHDVINPDDFSALEHYVEEDDKETKTTSTKPWRRSYLLVSGLPADSKWILEWSFEFCSSRSSRKSIGYASVHFGEKEIALDHVYGDNWKVSAGSKLLTLDSSTHLFSIYYWAKSRRYPTSIRRLKIRLVRNKEA